MSNEHDSEDLKFVALYHGVVTNNADPLKIGRVKLRIPGVVEPDSDWAFPLAMAGGGENAIGFYAVPKIGAEVGVWFLQGDPDRPFYVAGHWGAPGNVGQAPTPVREATAADAPLIRCLETENYLLIFDDRPASKGFEIRDKSCGDRIAYDGVTRAIELKSTTAIRITSTGAVDISGLTITLNGRPVMPSGDAI